MLPEEKKSQVSTVVPATDAQWEKYWKFKSVVDATSDDKLRDLIMSQYASSLIAEDRYKCMLTDAWNLLTFYWGGR